MQELSGLPGQCLGRQLWVQTPLLPHEQGAQLSMSSSLRL